VPGATAAEVAAAVEAAAGKAAWWAARTAQQRSAVLHSFANALEQRASDLTLDLAISEGIPHALARETELPGAVRNLRYWANRILNENGRSHQEPGGPLHFEITAPLGVVGLLLPAAGALSWLTQFAGAALAAGNTVVAKPSPRASFVASRIALLLNEAGLPPGALNFVYGSEVSAGWALLNNPQVSLVMAAGHPASVREIGARAHSLGKRFVGEEFGRQATLVMADADLSDAAIACVRGAYSIRNEGGLDASLVLVDRAVFPVFVEKLTRTASLLRLGHPEDRATQVGPLPSAEARQALLTYGQASRGELLLGGKIPNLGPELEKGFFFAPALLTFEDAAAIPAAPPGPLLCAAPFDAGTKLSSLARDEDGFHAVSLWGKDLGKTHAMARGFNVGSVVINAWGLSHAKDAFGGAKRSARAAADLYPLLTRHQSVHVKF